jgi:prepilin-type processing-associated H-X9-DG protein
MAPWRRKATHAFNLPELCLVLAILSVAVILFGIQLPKAKAKAQQIKCARQLKSTALSFKMFAGDNDGRFPFFVTNALAYQDSTHAWVHFQTLSNELGGARILTCPSDVARQKSIAIPFTDASNGLVTLQNQAVSYFVNVDANETNGNMVLIGDRNLLIAGQSPTSTGLTLPGTTLLQWNRDIHGLRGNVARADGSVFSQIPSIQIWTNHPTPMRLAIP